MVLAGVHPSLKITRATRRGRATWQLPSTLTSGTAEHLTTGAVVSVTVKVVVQEALLPAASVAVTVTVCGPKPARDTARGDCMTVSMLAAVLCSLTVTPLNTFGTATW